MPYFYALVYETRRAGWTVEIASETMIHEVLADDDNTEVFPYKITYADDEAQTLYLEVDFEVQLVYELNESSPTTVKPEDYYGNVVAIPVNEIKEGGFFT